MYSELELENLKNGLPKFKCIVCGEKARFLDNKEAYDWYCHNHTDKDWYALDEDQQVINYQDPIDLSLSRVNKTHSWWDLKSRPVYTEDGINTMRKHGTHEHYGNPFSFGVAGLIECESIQQAVDRYRSWLFEKNDEFIPNNKLRELTKQRNWILSEISYRKLENTPLLYMNKKIDGKFYYSHADALYDGVRDSIIEKRTEGR